MDNNRPNIFKYSDYRAFLQDMYTYHKAINRNFSHRLIAQQVGASSSGWFADIVKGRINLTGRLAEKLIRIIHLNTDECEYFELLVRYDQAGSLDEKNTIVKKLTSCKRVDASIVSKDQFDFYSTWYIPAIRELLFTYNFSGNFKELGRKMSPSITEAQARRAITVLDKLGFIAKNSAGCYKPVMITIKKDPSFKSIQWANYMRANITLALESLEKHHKEERDISAVTIGLSEQGLSRAREEIAALRKKLLAISENDSQQSIIYNCTIQLYPITRNQ